LKFSYDRGDIGCAFKQHIEANNQYMVSSVYKFLYPEQVYTEGNEQENAWDSKVQLSRYSKIINAKLKNILNGDFSWINEYLKKDKRNGQLSLFVLGLGSEHPITKKFFGGDRSWESDAEQYIALNNIILPDNKWNN